MSQDISEDKLHALYRDLGLLDDEDDADSEYEDGLDRIESNDTFYLAVEVRKLRNEVASLKEEVARLRQRRRNRNAHA